MSSGAGGIGAVRGQRRERGQLLPGVSFRKVRWSTGGDGHGFPERQEMALAIWNVS